MADELEVKADRRRRPLAVLPRGRRRTKDGEDLPPVVVVDIEFGKRDAGCCVCDTPIPKDTTRISINVTLVEPIDMPGGGRRIHERYFAHPGCLTDRVRPEVIRFGQDCYDCGAPPPTPKDEHGVVRWLRWSAHCFTVTKFAPAPLCPTCAGKPKWARCDVCQVYYPHWMVTGVAAPKELTSDDPWETLLSAQAVNVPNARMACGFCAKRHQIVTTEDADRAAKEFEKLRAEIAEVGFYEAGD